MINFYRHYHTMDIHDLKKILSPLCLQNLIVNIDQAFFFFVAVCCGQQRPQVYIYVWILITEYRKKIVSWSTKQSLHSFTVKRRRRETSNRLVLWQRSTRRSSIKIYRKFLGLFTSHESITKAIRWRKMIIIRLDHHVHTHECISPTSQKNGNFRSTNFKIIIAKICKLYWVTVTYLFCSSGSNKKNIKHVVFIHSTIATTFNLRRPWLDQVTSFFSFLKIQMEEEEDEEKIGIM
jgi:hypothetical protein